MTTSIAISNIKSITLYFSVGRFPEAISIRVNLWHKTQMKKMKTISKLLFALPALFLISCTSGPKVIQESEPIKPPVSSTGVFAEAADFQEAPSAGHTHKGPFDEEVHTVVALETLPTAKYVYIKAKEAKNEFWIATHKQEIKIGETYFYKGGLLKTNFESKEYDRVFDKIFLVSKLVPRRHGNEEQSHDKMHIPTHAWPSEGDKASNPKSPTKDDETISIAELVKTPKKFAGQKIKVKGTCIKTNPNIMNRNWIHLQDGSADDYDLVVTTQAQIHPGETVKMEALVSVEKDFGSGYFYKLILEDGKMIAH